ncbi:MAG TPA: magnesium chelatase [Spirochaetia bacterium]|nr:MAG: magnesium chelatase [Spirochaetes bacterium GWB1_36_13]HCL57910.1 magnesium chelatase [Spirochaetia bacterium]
MEWGNLKDSIAFAGILAAIFLFIFGFKKRKEIIEMIRFKVDVHNQFFKKTLMVSGLFFITLSLLDPKILTGFIPIKEKGLDIYFLIDVSKSMLSEDVKPNRLERVKQSILELLDLLPGDRVGLIPFASDAYIQLPLTDDYEMVKMFLDSVDTEMMGGGGTNIAKALEISKDSFENAGNGERVLILFSDGEEHNEEALKAAKKLSKIRIYTLGVGSLEGSLIPELDRNGNKIGFKKDSEGNYITSKINLKLLNDLALSASGRSYTLSLAGNEIHLLYDELEFLKRGEKKESQSKDYFRLYQFFLGFGILLFLLGYFYESKS